MSRLPTVLIIEDEAVIATDIELLLIDAGVEVVGWATNAENARRLAEDNRPDVALVDIQLRRGEDGIELARELAERFEVQIIFLTAQSDPATVARAQGVNHLAYIGKPYSPANLLAVVQQIPLRQR